MFCPLLVGRCTQEELVSQLYFVSAARTLPMCQACAYVGQLRSAGLASPGEALPTSLAALQAVHWNEDEVYRFLLAFYGQPGDGLQAAAASDELKARFKRSRWAASACS